MKILLVEDDPAALDTLRQGLALSFPTFTIETAISAEDAEEKIGAGYLPRLVITDVRLPGKSGVDLLLQLQEKLHDVQFILTSGYDPPEIPRQADDDRLLRFLPKPFELTRLFSEVQGAFLRDQFSGSHRSITFIDILQVLNMARRTALVQLLNGGESAGEVYLERGEVRHAACGELEGEQAFFRLCRSSDLAFRVRTGKRPPRRTVERSLDTLLIDVMSDE